MRPMFGGFRGKVLGAKAVQLLCYAAWPLLLPGCKCSSESAPQPVRTSAASASSSGAPLASVSTPAPPDSAPAPIDSSDPGAIVEAEAPVLDQPIPIDSCVSLGFCRVYPDIPVEDLNAVWAFSKTDAWVVGNGGTALRWNGKRFRSVDTSTIDDLVAIWAAAPNDLYVLGRYGTLLRWNGKSFESLWRSDSLQADAAWDIKGKRNAIDRTRPPPQAKHLGVRGSFGDELKDHPDHPPPLFYDLWGSGGQLWVVGDIEIAPPYKAIPRGAAGLLRHFDGVSWSSQTWEQSGSRVSVWGRSENDVFLWSALDYVVRWEGTGWWTPRPLPTLIDFEAFHARSLEPEYVAIWQQTPSDSWVVRWRDAGELVERINFRNGGQPRQASFRARLAFLTDTVRDIRGSASDDVWLVGKRGLLLHFDGVRWRGRVPAADPQPQNRPEGAVSVPEPMPLSEPPPELKSLITEENLSQFSASSEKPGVWFASAGMNLVRVQDGQITDRAVLLISRGARFAAADGSFWVSAGHGIAAYEPGKGFRYSLLPGGRDIKQISGDAENVWILAGPTVWRKPLSQP
jgi:hypothetical protein